MRSRSFSLGVCERRDKHPQFCLNFSSNFRVVLLDRFATPGPPNFRVTFPVIEINFWTKRWTKVWYYTNIWVILAKNSFIIILLFDVNILIDIFLLIWCQYFNRHFSIDRNYYNFLYSCIYLIEFHLLYIKFHPLCCNICIYENCYNNCNNINISNNNKSSINSLL